MFVDCNQIVFCSYISIFVILRRKDGSKLKLNGYLNEKKKLYNIKFKSKIEKKFIACVAQFI